MNPKKPRNKCKFCNTEVKRAVDVYCNLKCLAEHRKQLTKEKIETTGKIYNPQQARKYLVELYGRVCSICHITSWQGKELPVIVDHIDGNPENDFLTNLRLVCPNCDAQLPTSKGKNRGNGRAYRRQRYKEGKSY